MLCSSSSSFTLITSPVMKMLQNWMNLSAQMSMNFTTSWPNFVMRLPDMNRSELQDQMVQQMLDDMDLKTMTCLCYDYLMEGYDKYSDEELTEEVNQYYPELLEGWCNKLGGRGCASWASVHQSPRCPPSHAILTESKQTTPCVSRSVTRPPTMPVSGARSGSPRWQRQSVWWTSTAPVDRPPMWHLAVWHSSLADRPLTL